MITANDARQAVKEYFYNYASPTVLQINDDIKGKSLNGERKVSYKANELSSTDIENFESRGFNVYGLKDGSIHIEW